MAFTTLESIDGSGTGSGDRYGYGYGYVSGSGYGYVSGDNDYFASYARALAGANYPEAKIAFWRCNDDNTSANGGSGTVAKEGLTETTKGPLKICTCNALHGTLSPSNWKGSKWWLVALHEPVQKQGDKIASLKRTFIKDLGKCPF